MRLVIVERSSTRPGQHGRNGIRPGKRSNGLLLFGRCGGYNGMYLIRRNFLVAILRIWLPRARTRVSSSSIYTLTYPILTYGYRLDTLCIQFGYILDTFWIQFGYIMDTFWIQNLGSLDFIGFVGIHLDLFCFLTVRRTVPIFLNVIVNLPMSNDDNAAFKW